MRIPQVGESGWQVVSVSGFWEGWRDCEIIALGDFYTRNGFKPIRVKVCGRDSHSGVSPEQLRRKPQQKDTQSADESFQRGLKQMLAPGRVRS